MPGMLLIGEVAAQLGDPRQTMLYFAVVGSVLQALLCLWLPECARMTTPAAATAASAIDQSAAAAGADMAMARTTALGAAELSTRNPLAMDTTTLPGSLARCSEGHY